MKALGVKGITLLNEPNDPIQELSLKGTFKTIDFDKEDLVKKCYEFIGADIVECIHLASLGLDMWIDEEGKLKENVYPNLDATALFIREFGVQDMIMGHVVFTSDRCDDEGWALGLDDNELKKLEEAIRGIQAMRPERTYAIDQLDQEPKRG